VTVRDVLVADPRVIAGDAPAREVAELLSRPHVETALVVDGDRLVGCVARESIVAAVARGADVRSLAARDLVDDDVTTISPDASLDEALRLMGERGLERLAVTQEGRLLGVVAREPLVRRIMEDEPPPGDEEPLGVG
jgi:predicted transcriptional regulator